MAFTAALDGLDGQAEAGAFAFVMLDANNLKKINDEHGHEAGDAYLQAAAAEMQEAFGGLPVYRVGGDEFVVVAGASDHDVVKGGIAQIDARCERLATQEGLKDWERVSLAAGHASHREAEEPADTLARADARMYQRKQDMKVAR
jgi:diguanylate cyclase (GGDEF)-like protein